MVSCESKQNPSIEISSEELSELHVDQYHGYEHIDDLQFLEKKDEQGRPLEKTQRIINQYNAKSDSFFSEDAVLLEEIYQEILSRRPKKVSVPPHSSRGISFFEELEEDEKFPTIYYQPEGSKEKKLLIDQPKRAEGVQDYKLHSYELSPNNELLSWVDDTQSGSLSTLYISTIGEPDDYIHKIEFVGTEFIWGNESKRLYYSLVDPDDLRFYQIRMFNVDTKEDVEIYTELDDKYLTFISAAPGSNGVFIYNINWSVYEALYIDFDKSYSEHELVVSRELEMTFDIGKFDDVFVISYQADETTSKLASFRTPNSHIDTWETLYSTKASISSVALTANYFTFMERAEGADQVKSLDASTLKVSDIGISIQRYGASFVWGSHDLNRDVIRVAYDTYLSTRTLVDIDLSTNKVHQVYSPVIPNFSPEDYVVEFKYMPSHDGVMVPATIIKRKDTQLPAPAYQYVYGSYGYGMTPRLPFFAISLIDRGFVYVVSHVRGGNELGNQWHEGGRKLNRRNTFKDFLAISEYLVSDGYTTEGNISISGESAAGTILGVAVNEKPHYYKSLTSLVPTMDIFNKLLNPSLMITKTSWSEFGNPIDSKEAYQYIRGYSPLENLTPQNYPDYYITARLGDRNVDFFEPLKWAIKVDTNDTKIGLNLVKIEDGDHVRTGFGGVEYDFAKQMYFIFKTHQ